MAWATCVPEELREIKLGTSTFCNSKNDFLVRPLDVISEEEQVDIEARKIRLQYQVNQAWVPAAKALLEDFSRQDSTRTSGLITNDLQRVERRLKYEENLNLDEIAKSSVQYALSSCELLDTTKPLCIGTDKRFGLYWEEGGLIVSKDPPFITRRYSDTDLVKTNIDPLIRDLLYRLQKKETMIPGDQELAPIAQTYVDALERHQARIPQGRTGLKITRRGCYYRRCECC